MRNYTIPKYPEYDENIRMLENTDPADADSIFNPLFSKMINNTAAIRSNFNGVTMKNEEILNLSNTRDYDYLSLELGGNTRVTPENPDLPISPDNVASIESVGEDGGISILSSGKNLIRHNRTFPQSVNGVTLTYNEKKGAYTLNGTATATFAFELFASTDIKILQKGAYAVSIKYISGTITGTGQCSIRNYTSQEQSNGSAVNLSKQNIEFSYHVNKVVSGFLQDVRIGANSGTIFSDYTVIIQIEFCITRTSIYLL